MNHDWMRRLALYASAVDDHTEEIVQRAPIDGWRETPEEIEKLLRKQLGTSDAMRKLAPADYKLTRARVCDLGSEQYVHLDYKNEQREISIYIRPKGSKLPGVVIETVNGCALHAESTGGFEVACAQDVLGFGGLGAGWGAARHRGMEG